MKLALSLAAFSVMVPSLTTLHAADAPPSSAKPNVVFLLGDDVGWSDVSTHLGGFIPTPNIDHMFK
jgi:hypothetical protein